MLARSRVLAVDDNPTNLAVIEESLQEQFTLRLARSGEDALRLAPTFLPDVVLLDAMMPRPDGFEVCSKLKNDPLLRRSHVIMVSARTAVDDRLRGYRAGADDYVCKPFDEQELCAKVSAAMNTRELCRGVHADLEQFCGATGEALELLTHLRDTETGEHLDRMREYSQILAGELRSTRYGEFIDDLFLDRLYRASALHDVGKIAIPDAVLRHPGALSPEQRETMQRHTTIGGSILARLAGRQSSTGFFEMAAQIARWHHERFDGTGYPDKLSGDSIPLAARIVKVADVFDALTTHRAYKPRFPFDHAVEIIACGSGTEFDPVVVDAMFRVLDEFRDVCDSPRWTEAPQL